MLHITAPNKEVITHRIVGSFLVNCNVAIELLRRRGFDVGHGDMGRTWFIAVH